MPRTKTKTKAKPKKKTVRKVKEEQKNIFMPNAEELFFESVLHQLSCIGDALEQLVSHDNKLVQLTDIKHWDKNEDHEIDATDEYDGSEVETDPAEAFEKIAAE